MIQFIDFRDVITVTNHGFAVVRDLRPRLNLIPQAETRREKEQNLIMQEQNSWNKINHILEPWLINPNLKFGDDCCSYFVLVIGLSVVVKISLLTC